MFHGERLGNSSAPLFFEREGNRAVRDERRKLVANYDQPWNLYDMSTDRSETTNLAASQPDQVFKMAAQRKFRYLPWWSRP